MLVILRSVAAVGSSPRVRGTVLPRALADNVDRFIPACAGNRPGGWPERNRCSVHPRVCGEQAEHSLSADCPDGSSPRVRGAAREVARRADVGRFIPACAGNRGVSAAGAVQVTVHPRVCGEQRALITPIASTVGSSPRVRGTEGVDHADCLDGRFIPACAGNRAGRARRCRCGTVHPRVCGEQANNSKFGLMGDGSSPRVRGTGEEHVNGWTDNRFIPACAGNSLDGSKLSRVWTVHPRVCGEQSKSTLRPAARCGSSPRVRGTERFRRQLENGGRFIPACAGNRICKRTTHRKATVHPRVCGEQEAADIQSPIQNGSSPRVRGTAGVPVVVVILVRFIPACAGNRLPCMYLISRTFREDGNPTDISHAGIHPRGQVIPCPGSLALA